ncbi:MAG: universal stress protein [Nitrospirota bacterium]
MHFLLALDESRYADAIVAWMARFPHPVGSRLTLVHVLEPWDVPKTVAQADRTALQRRRDAGAQSLLARAAHRLWNAYSGVETIVLEGLPIYELLRLIHAKRPDVVVSGTRGLEAAKGLVLGSVSQRLLTYAPCSAMLIPAKTKAARRMKVMLATDGSPGAEEAARFLTALPDLDRITVLSAARPISPLDIARGAGGDKRKARELAAELMKSRLEAAQRAVERTVKIASLSGATIKTSLVTGHPAEVIPRAARRSRCDLLVIGSRGLTGREATALGSVSLAVAQQAPCPVLVVKPS